MDTSKPNRTEPSDATHNPYWYLPDGKAPPTVQEIRSMYIQLSDRVRDFRREEALHERGFWESCKAFDASVNRASCCIDLLIQREREVQAFVSDRLGLVGEKYWFFIGPTAPFDGENVEYVGWLSDTIRPKLSRIVDNGGMPEVPADVGNPDNLSDLILSIDRMRRWFALGDLLRPDVREKLADYHAHEIVMLDAAFNAVGRSMPDIIIRWMSNPGVEREADFDAMLVKVRDELRIKAAAQRLKPAPAIIDQPDAAPPVASIKTVKPKRASAGKVSTDDKIDLAIGEMRRNPQGTLDDYAAVVREKTGEPFDKSTLSRSELFNNARRVMLGQVARGHVKTSGTGRNRDRTIEATDDE